MVPPPTVTRHCPSAVPSLVDGAVDARIDRFAYRSAIIQCLSLSPVRRSILHDDRYYQRLLAGLEQTESRFGCDLLSFALIPGRIVGGPFSDLEPTDRMPDLPPVDGMPVGRTFGSRTSGISAADISACLPESVDQGSLVRRHQREVRPLSRRVISSEGSTLIRPIPGRHSLPPSSSARHPISNLLAEGLPREEDDGLTTFHGCTTDGLGSASPPMARQRRQGNGEPLHLAIYLLVQACHAFGLLEITAFISSSPELAMPSTLAPDRRGASSRRVLSRETRPPGSGEVTLSQELRTVGLLRPHVLVGYQWSHTGLCPGCRPVITATSAASCRTSSFSGLGYPTQ